MEKKGSLKVVTNFNMCEVTSEEVLNKDSPFVMTYTPVQKSSKSNPDSCTSPKQNQVSAVMLFGVPIVALLMDGKDRLCLAQISSTLLKEFSYNEIHNRRVALGITCIQCTPVQLEILRRAGAMPVTSRRCGMITRREAERLCQSFLGEHSPPQLPENFTFDVYHECAWGCRGNFVPSRYNSSRAKCIRCAFCQLFFSPNKFIFHSHRLPESRYVQPDAANFNSWRRHLRLYGDPPEDVSSLSPSLLKGPTRPAEALSHNTLFPLHKDKVSSQAQISDDFMDTAQICYAWEDCKALFNGGTRKRLLAAHSTPPSHSPGKRNSPPKISPTGSYTGNNVSTTTSPQSSPLPIQQFHSGNNHKILGTSLDSGGTISSSFFSPNPGSSHRFLNSGKIWNPGVSSLSEKGRPDGSPIQNLPLGIHPLSIPWLRRPMFPFAHPFEPNCKYLGDGSVFPEVPMHPINARLQSSAFRPVRQPSNAAEHIFSTWLNNSAFHGNFIQVPEDLSLNSGSSSNTNSTSPIFLHSPLAGIESVKLVTEKMGPDTKILNRAFRHDHTESNLSSYCNARSQNSKGLDESCPSDEETVDIESTDSEKVESTSAPDGKTTESHQTRKSLKRTLEPSDSEVDVDSNDDVDIPEESGNFCLQQRPTSRYPYYTTNQPNGESTSKKKKRLWDFGTSKHLKIE